MAVARYRKKGPVLTPVTKLGEEWWDTPWFSMKLSDLYYPTPANQRVEKREECWDETHPGPPWRDGGPLRLVKYKSPYAQVRSGTYCIGWERYKGAFANIHPDNCDGEYGTMLRDLAADGAAGWKRFRPTKPKVNLGQTIAEMREFHDLLAPTLKSLKEVGAWGPGLAKDLGSSHLAYHFGWKPLISDLKKTIKTMFTVEKTIDFIRKNNNKWLTRGGTLDTDYESTVEEVDCRVTPQLNNYYHGTPWSQYPQPKTKIHCVKSTRSWFKARMKYYIPNLSLDRCRDIWTSPLLRRIYGVELTPSLLWELTPWSWLADWFANVGDVLENLSHQSYDNLVAKYAYVMEHKIIRYHMTSELRITTDDGNIAIPVKSTYELESKNRQEASPFGFGSSWDSFSDYQLSILAALAVTRVR